MDMVMDATLAISVTARRSENESAKLFCKKIKASAYYLAYQKVKVLSRYQLGSLIDLFTWH